MSIDSNLLNALGRSRAIRRRIFVSYHHRRDQGFYDLFSTIFDQQFEAVRDNSLDREIESVDPTYVMRTIREGYITGTSSTIVLCGAETPWRKYVDWEIKATLDKQHALIGVNLPTNPVSSLGFVTLPARLQDNIQSGFAVWIAWEELALQGPPSLIRRLAEANSRPKRLIKNDRLLMSRNGVPPWRR